MRDDPGRPRRPREGGPPPQPTGGESPPVWAQAQAADEGDQDEPVEGRAWELVRERQQRYDERHDEYDDPDQGGEG